MTSTSGTSRVRRRVAAVVAVLLVAAAALLVVGVLLERHTESGAEHPVVGAATGEQQESHHDESTEGARAEPATAPGNPGGEAAEQLTGINVETPWVVALGAIASLALAVAVWMRPNRVVVVIVVVFTAAALVLDVLEINHQSGAERMGLIVLAGVIAALRVAIIVGSAYLFRSRPAAM